jgi:hypothetical protein
MDLSQSIALSKVALAHALEKPPRARPRIIRILSIFLYNITVGVFKIARAPEYNTTACQSFFFAQAIKPLPLVRK